MASVKIMNAMTEAFDRFLGRDETAAHGPISGNPVGAGAGSNAGLDSASELASDVAEPPEPRTCWGPPPGGYAAAANGTPNSGSDFGFVATPPEPAASSPAAVPAHADWLIVGLGNPGANYEITKHNIGYLVLDELGFGESTPTSLPGVKAEFNMVTWHGQRVALVRALTFMNESGLAVAPLAERFGVTMDHVLVVHDELDLPSGTVKLKADGNPNGHNGVKSIADRLATTGFPRIRVGIGRPPQGVQITDWVLSPLVDDTPSGFHDSTHLTETVVFAADAAHRTINQGVAKAQSKVNAKR